MHKSKENLDYAIITGGSSGIGYCLAECFLKIGVSVILVARDKSKLEDARKRLSANDFFLDQKIEILNLDLLDLNQNLSQLLDMFSGKKIKYLINSAGVVYPEYFKKTLPKEVMDTVLINFQNTILLTKSVIPYLTNNSYSYICFLSSSAAYLPVPAYGIYCATKSAVSVFAKILKMELAEDNVNISIAYPGETDTPMLASERLRQPLEIKKITNSFGVKSPQKVAEIIIKGIHGKRTQIFCDMGSYVLHFINNLFPGAVWHAIYFLWKKEKKV